MLKTREMVEWEYAPHLGRSTQQVIGASEDRMEWMRGAQSDYEIALPIHEIDNFVQSTGYYAGLPPEIRAGQLAQMIDLCDQLYPRLRLYLYDARQLYSAPITIFGPLLAVVYVGGHYLTFRERGRIETLSRHFDALVRQSVSTARDAAEYLRQFS
jgi:hypothetical protein